MSRNVLRVTAGTDRGARASVWRIYTHGDDIYVETRHAGGAIKTSLHKSGRFRHAFDAKHASRWVGDGDRAFVKWKEPEGEPGNVRLLLKIIMPTDELTVPAEEPADVEKVKLLDPAPAGEATVVSLWRLPPGEAVDSDGRRVTHEGKELIANWPLPEKGSLLIFTGTEPVKAEGIENAYREVAGQLADQHPEGASDPSSVRLVLFEHDSENDVASLIDLASPL
ncbi:MAG TPA: hypothetical protein VN618_10380 [Solirubrobacteraceae bacterium]|nr:hypothetical protein [Solirubrobacteraceae bacterium]